MYTEYDTNYIHQHQLVCILHVRIQFRLNYNTISSILEYVSITYTYVYVDYRHSMQHPNTILFTSIFNRFDSMITHFSGIRFFCPAQTGATAKTQLTKPKRTWNTHTHTEITKPRFQIFNTQTHTHTQFDWCILLTAVFWFYFIDSTLVPLYVFYVLFLLFNSYTYIYAIKPE